VEKDSWAVEIQGDQVARVTKALLDFGCLRGLSSSGLEAARSLSSDTKRSDSAVDRTAATKFLAQTRSGAAMSPEQERKRKLDQEAEFYGRFWEVLGSSGSGDAIAVWEDSDFGASASEQAADALRTAPAALPVLNAALQALGMLAEAGRAIKEFWDSSGFTMAQFRKMALNPGARLMGEGPGRKAEPTNLKSRQKLSDWRGAGSRKANFFSPSCSAIDNYERGKAGGKGRLESDDTPDVASSLVEEEDEDGWLRALLSYCVPLPSPQSRLDAAEAAAVSKKALRSLDADARIAKDLEGVQQAIPGVVCLLDCSTFGL
ncbi:unnamed protein product, partial [Polarella glacialis]